jgi:phosphoesterase RecJ-like protein
MIEHAARALEEGRRFLVTSHLNPDGDAVGSMLAMAHLLRDNGKEATTYHSDPMPGPYLFLAGIDEVVSTPELIRGEYDTLVVLDVGERERIPAVLPAGADRARIVVIDHHRHHGDYGDIVWRRPDASAVGEMIAELARFLGWKVSKDCAECAYVAVLTDTGSFRYSSTTSACLETAAWLVSHGVEPWKVASHVYESWPARRMLLLGDVLRTLEIECEGRLATLVVTKQALAAHQASVDMTEGFVNQGRMIDGVEVSVLFRERDPDTFRLSFRSRGSVDVGVIAHQLGGGGHPNAAGATATGKLDEIRAIVADLVSRALDEITPDDESRWSRH